MEHIILKLVDGTEVIGRVIEVQDDTIKIDNPMTINYSIHGRSYSAVLGKYAYFTDQEIFEFKKSFIVQALHPREDFTEYYEEVVNESVVILSDKDTRSEDTEEDDEMYRAMIERFGTSNSSLH